jgi:radical SAM protein with 4Fe4S-binding SPASM domain
MTTTKASLSRAKEIVDEYLKQGFSSIFLRTLNPYGIAASSHVIREYTIEEWIHFYKEAISYILELNQQGVCFHEEFSSIILRKILTPYATGFVDLQSPAGIGISGIVLNYNGDVYTSDEARMLAEMGDYKFKLGNLLTNSYEDIMLSDSLLVPLKETMTEGVPGCSDCGIQPYCGSDPVRHYRTQGDIVGFKPSSDFCKKNMGVIKHLIRLIEDDEKAYNVLKTWI